MFNIMTYDYSPSCLQCLTPKYTQQPKPETRINVSGTKPWLFEIYFD